MLLPEPITKEEFERELERLALSPGETESQREYWTLCDVFQALDNMRCRPPQWLLPKLEEVQRRPSDDRAEGYRARRRQLLEHLAQYQKETGWM